jgi:hypothetical protein
MLHAKQSRTELVEALDEVASILEDESLTPEEQVNEISDIVFGNGEEDED